GVDADDPYDQMPRPGFLGEESFIEEVLDKSGDEPISAEVPKRLRPALSLEQIEKHAGERNRAIAEAYSTGAYTLTEIARHFGIHLSTASRIARGVVNARNKT
ncbi:MAG: helix-turn-helix domain-containing protein, partial [Spiribacter salinus]